jgi:Protein of unknown function (DUF4199)
MYNIMQRLFLCAYLNFISVSIIFSYLKNSILSDFYFYTAYLFYFLIKIKYICESFFQKNFKTMLDQKISPDEALVPAMPISLRYGLILGLVSVILTLAMISMDMIDFSGRKSNILSNILSCGSAIAVLYFAINEHKTQELGGFISLGRCVKIGLLIGLIAGIISAVGLFIYFQFIAPDFLAGVMEQIREGLEEEGLSTDQIEQAMGFMKITMSPAVFSFFALIGSVILDVIFALSLGFFMKRESDSPFR